MFVCDTELIGISPHQVAIYWMGDEKNPKQYGVCFPGDYFNIARQSLAESLALANDVLSDAVDHLEEQKGRPHDPTENETACPPPRAQ